MAFEVIFVRTSLVKSKCLCGYDFFSSTYDPSKSTRTLACVLWRLKQRDCDYKQERSAVLLREEYNLLRDKMCIV